MDILYVSNEKMQRSYRSEAIFNKICTIKNMIPTIKDISVYSKQFHQLKSNVFLLLDNIRKMREFK